MQDKHADLGKDKILFFRKLSDAAKSAAAKLALQTQHTWNYSRSADFVQTKDGAVPISSGLECTLDISAISTKDEVNTYLLEAVKSGETMEVWEVDLATLNGDQCDALYARGKLESWEVPAAVDDATELSTSMKIEGEPQAGKVTLTADQKQTIQYAFRNLEKTGPAA